LALYGLASHAALADLGSFELAGAEVDDCELGDGREWAAFKERNMMPILKALNEEENFELGDRYYTSKLLVVYFFREFVAEAGETRVVINTVNPGFCHG
jgi:hypothetical protein